MTKDKMIKFLEYTQNLVYLSDKIYELDKDETPCIDYVFILDKVFLHFSGKNWSIINESYACPGNSFTGKPIAWYGTAFKKPPYKNYSGFIPEVISDVVINNRDCLSCKEMYKVLKRLFKDLERVSDETI